MQAVEAKPEVEQPAIDNEADQVLPAQQAPAVSTSEGSCCAEPARSVGGRRAWVIAGALVVPLALYAGWDWLAATGFATILVAAAPCLLMCALGLCMRHGKTAGAPSLAEVRKTYETGAGEPPKHG